MFSLTAVIATDVGYIPSSTAHDGRRRSRVSRVPCWKVCWKFQEAANHGDTAAEDHVG